MTKADWLDFFEAINGRSATEEEIAAALAAGEFQDDAPAVETAPTQEAPVQPAFANATTDFRECPRSATTANFRWCPRSATTADFCECPRRASASSFCKCSGSPSTTNLCRVLKLLQYKECQIKQRNHKLVLPMLKLVNKQLLLTVNRFNQVKMFNLSMAKL